MLQAVFTLNRTVEILISLKQCIIECINVTAVFSINHQLQISANISLKQCIIENVNVKLTEAVYHGMLYAVFTLIHRVQILISLKQCIIK